MNIYNTLSRRKEVFEPVNPPFVGIYVCGPTVYGDAHLGHARPAITFDLVFRYLQYLGYKVRYVRNITDVGHLTNDSDDGEDKIEKKAKADKLEPMEIVQYYTNRYHKNMEQLNTLPPSIEPHAICSSRTMNARLRKAPQLTGTMRSNTGCTTTWSPSKARRWASRWATLSR